LSQLPDVDVLGTDRLVQILADLRRQDDRTISYDTVQAVAKRAGISTIVLGSYVKAGDTIRINIKLQEPSTGRIITAERVEAVGESNLFPMVDELTRRIKARFAPATSSPAAGLLPARLPTAGNDLDRALRDVATASIDAYRYYSEGVNLHDRGRDTDAIPLLEKAIAADPNFALAHMKLAVAHGNLLHFPQERDAMKRALDLAGRLPARERRYVEGYYYGLDPSTIDKSVAAYRAAIELYPNHDSARHNLGIEYLMLERWDDAIEQFELLRRSVDYPFPETYRSLATAYAARGDLQNAEGVARQFVGRSPDSALGHLGLAEILMISGRWDDAQAAFDTAQALEPREPFPLFARRAIYIVRDQWTEHADANRRLRESADESSRTIGFIGEAVAAVYHGRGVDAAKSYERAIRESGGRGGPASAAALGLGDLLLERGQPEPALAEAERARRVTDVLTVRLNAEVLAAAAQAKLQRFTPAAQAADDLARTVGVTQSRALTRFRNLIAGRVALERQDATTAVRVLRDAESMLPAHVLGPSGPGRSATVWYWLARAHLAAGNDAEAAVRFQRLVDSGIERANRPIEYVKSLYYLAQVAERQGDRSKAGEYYRRFLTYWGDGDLGRDLVADARRKTAGTKP
jgi:tetratricopeptide (TPR) repeat protein